MTSQHILYYYTYYSVSLTCTAHCTYYTYRTLYTQYMDTELNRAPSADPAMERTALAASALHRATRAVPASRDTSAMKPQVEDPEEGPGEAAIDGSRANDSTTRAADSLKTPPVTSWTLPIDVTSTGVDSGVMPPAMLEQMAWDTSVMRL